MEKIVQIFLVSVDKVSLKVFTRYLKIMTYKLSLKTFSIQGLPKSSRKITLLKSPHVDKRAREQFEIIYYKILISIRLKKHFKKFMELISNNKPKNLKFSIKYSDNEKKLCEN